MAKLKVAHYVVLNGIALVVTLTLVSACATSYKCHYVYDVNRNAHWSCEADLPLNPGPVAQPMDQYDPYTGEVIDPD